MPTWTPCPPPAQRGPLIGPSAFGDVARSTREWWPPSDLWAQRWPAIRRPRNQAGQAWLVRRPVRHHGADQQHPLPVRLHRNDVPGHRRELPRRAGRGRVGRTLGAPRYITTIDCAPNPTHDSVNAPAPSKRVVLRGLLVVSDEAADHGHCPPGQLCTVTPGASCAQASSGWYGCTSTGTRRVAPPGSRPLGQTHPCVALRAAQARRRPVCCLDSAGWAHSDRSGLVRPATLGRGAPSPAGQLS